MATPARHEIDLTATDVSSVPVQHHRSRQHPMSLYSRPDGVALSRMVTSPQTEPAAEAENRAATVTRLHRVPAHTITGCPLQLMAEVSSTVGDCTGVVRFFDQFGLLGAASIDPECGIATLPYVFTSGGRRELSATFDGGPEHSTSRSAIASIQIYSGSDGPASHDIIRISL